MADELDFGIEQYKAGNKVEARRIFLKVIKEHPHYTRAYQWLYNVARDDNERMNILKKILEINPTHEQALKLYKELSIKYQPPPQLSVQRQVPRWVEPKKPAPKNNNLLIGIGAAIVILICCMCVAIGLNGLDTTTPSLLTSGYQVKYVLTGTARSAMVTYDNETGGMEQRDVNLPWTKEMIVELGAPLSIVAQNNGTGSITCEIWVNGEKRKTSTSTAQYGVVTCSDWIFE